MLELDAYALSFATHRILDGAPFYDFTPLRVIILTKKLLCSPLNPG